MSASPRLQAAWLRDPAVTAVMAALSSARPLFVGGCVRDALLGRPTHDVDVCVVSPPERTTQLLEAAGLKAVPTGVAHGTVTAVSGGRGVEVTTLRRDVATDGRRAVVAFTEDVAEDAGRRDFTMNALYADAGGAVLDPLGGLPDLMAGRVRFIGDPARRLAEDRLRALRFFRFTAWFAAGPPDAEGSAACAASADALGALSAERVGAEMRRLFAAPAPARAAAAMARSGVAAVAAPGLDPDALAALSATEAAVAAPPRWMRRVVAGGVDPGGWRLSRAETKALQRLRGAVAEAGRTVAAVAHLHGAAAAADALLIAGTPPDAAAEAEIARGAAARPPVTARDVAALGVAQGPAVGAALDWMRARWLDADLRADKAVLLAAWRAARAEAS